MPVSMPSLSPRASMSFSESRAAAEKQIAGRGAIGGLASTENVGQIPSQK
jgi:hypothetical protein